MRTEAVMKERILDIVWFLEKWFASLEVVLGWGV